MDDMGDIRARMRELGERAFNAASEEAVAAFRDRAFPGLAADGVVLSAGVASTLLTLCRLMLTARAIGEATGADPRVLWAFMKLAALDPVLDGEITDPDVRARWGDIESHLVAVAFEEV